MGLTSALPRSCLVMSFSRFSTTLMPANGSVSIGVLRFGTKGATPKATGLCGAHEGQYYEVVAPLQEKWRRE